MGGGDETKTITRETPLSLSLPRPRDVHKVFAAAAAAAHPSRERGTCSEEVNEFSLVHLLGMVAGGRHAEGGWRIRSGMVGRESPAMQEEFSYSAFLLRFRRRLHISVAPVFWESTGTENRTRCFKAISLHPAWRMRVEETKARDVARVGKRRIRRTSRTHHVG